MMTNVFISDLHLDESRPDITQGFLRFLKNDFTTTQALYILGDLFEVWLGDDDSSVFNQTIIKALAELKLPIYLMHGNRDFLLGDDFCRQIGATLLKDPQVVDIDGENVLLMHGDSLCTDDTEYMRARSILRSQKFQADFLQKTITERALFAQTARDQSKVHTRETAVDIMDVNVAAVNQVLTEHKVSVLIHGHTHRPYVHQLTLHDRKAKRVVLGAWDTQGWCLIAERGNYDLRSFELGGG